MAEVTDLVPALALHRQIEALALLGLDANAVRAQLGELPATPDALVHTAKYAEMWSVAQRLYGLPGLPTALAMAIPFGAFGALDYLAGSAETVAAACESVSLHLSMVAIDVRLQREEIGDGLRVLEVRGVGSMPADALEFTMASIIGRLRYVTRDALCLVAVGLPVQRPEHDPVRTRLYGVPVNYAHPCASCTLDADGWAMNTSSADPFLHATLAAVASQLQLAPRPGSELEQAMRVRLRDALAHGRADPERLASLIGVSERTLQRRLQDQGRSFSAVATSSGMKKPCGCRRTKGCISSRSRPGSAMRNRPRSLAPSGAGLARRRAPGEQRGRFDERDRRVRFTAGISGSPVRRFGRKRFFRSQLSILRRSS